MRTGLIAFAIGFLLTAVWGQGLEEWIEAAQDPEDLQAWLEELRRDPLDLNEATAQQISALPLMDGESARRVERERARRGGFEDLTEALRIPALSTEQRDVLREFCTVHDDAGRRGVQARVGAGASDFSQNALRADEYWTKSLLRFHSLGRRTGYVDVRRRAQQPSLFDHTSAGLEIEPEGSFPRLLIGDFQQEAGTGLVFASASGISNWLSAPGRSVVGQAKGLVLRPSANRRSLFRGVAAEQTVRWLSMTALGSINRLDGGVEAGLTEGESADGELGRARRDQIEERLLGFALAARTARLRVGVEGYGAHFAPALRDSDAVVPEFAGSELEIGSVFAAVDYGSLAAVAEAAKSSPGGAAVQGAVCARTERTRLTVFHVSAASDFYSPHGSLWSASGGTANRQCSGVTIQAMPGTQNVSVSARLDRTPFRTASAPLGTTSHEIELRGLLAAAKDIRIELLGTRTVHEGASRVQRGRVEVRWQPHEEYRLRFELRGSTQPGDLSHHLSTLLFFQTKADLLGATLTGRITVFGLDEGAGAVQVYESAPGGAYPLVALSGSGRRVMLAAARHWHGWGLEGRVAQATVERSGSEHSTVDVALGLSYQR